MLPGRQAFADHQTGDRFKGPGLHAEFVTGTVSGQVVVGQQRITG